MVHLKTADPELGVDFPSSRNQVKKSWKFYSGVVFGKLTSHVQNYASWWLNQPIWKMFVKLDHFPMVRGENKKYLSCHHPAMIWIDLRTTDLGLKKKNSFPAFLVKQLQFFRGEKNPVRNKPTVLKAIWATRFKPGVPYFPLYCLFSRDP